MLKIHLQLMAFVMVSIVFYEKIITSDDEQSNNSFNQLVVYQLDLRASARYASVLYDAHQKATDEEPMYYHGAVNNMLRRRINHNLTANQIEQRNLLFIAMPPVVLSASSLSVVQEEEGKDPDDDSDDSAATDKWSINTNTDVSVFDNIDATIAAVVCLRRSISSKSSSQKSDASLDSKDIHDLNDDDFRIGSSSSTVFTQNISFNPGKLYPKTPYHSPEDNSPNNERSNDEDLV